MAEHIIKYPHQYNEAIKKFATTDKGHANVFNLPVDTLINNDAYLKERADSVDSVVSIHTKNADIHVTKEWKDSLKNKAENETATITKNGLMSSWDKGKLDGISATAEVNQNAFAGIKAGNSIVTANGKTAQMEIVQGEGVQVTGDNASKKITISAANVPRLENNIITLNNSVSSLKSNLETQTVNLNNAITATNNRVAAVENAINNISVIKSIQHGNAHDYFPYNGSETIEVPLSPPVVPEKCIVFIDITYSRFSGNVVHSYSLSNTLLRFDTPVAGGNVTADEKSYRWQIIEFY